MIAAYLGYILGRNTNHVLGATIVVLLAELLLVGVLIIVGIGSTNIKVFIGLDCVVGTLLCAAFLSGVRF